MSSVGPTYCVLFLFKQLILSAEQKHLKSHLDWTRVSHPGEISTDNILLFFLFKFSENQPRCQAGRQIINTKIKLDRYPFLVNNIANF